MIHALKTCVIAVLESRGVYSKVDPSRLDMFVADLRRVVALLLIRKFDGREIIDSGSLVRSESQVSRHIHIR
jgi:hypothetical protein